jgi:LysR family transcriptional activator of nhaA
MDWLNYHHLRYFWTVAKEGSLAQAAAKLHVSQPSISEQIRELEESLGEKLFRREGRSNRLTDAGQIVFRYADEIFALGREMMNSVKQRPGAKTLRSYVGITDSLPKVVANEILKPAFALSQGVHVICREGKLDDLLVQLAGHHLDLVLSDEPASSSADFKTQSHPLGDCGAVICAEKKLAAKLKRDFPRSLHHAPALLPYQNTMLRRSLEIWFRKQQIQPQVIVECEDLALMKVMAADGRGFIALPDVGLHDGVRRYGFNVVGVADGCRLQFYAITIDRRISNPVVTAITSNARSLAKAE